MIRSRILDEHPRIRYAFGSAEASAPDWFRNHLDRAQWKQVHGIAVTDIHERSMNCGETDGFVTSTSIPIGVVTADCLPILGVNQPSTQIAAIHAGWRGLVSGILDSLGTSVERSGRDFTPRTGLSDWSFVIGPGIRACCYEVDASLIERFVQTFPAVPRTTISPTDRKLDLAAIAAAKLRSVGVPSERIEILPHCTYCSTTPRFESFRRDHESRRQTSVLQIEGEVRDP